MLHTRGISIKFPSAFKGQNLIILDTAGKSAPVIGDDEEALVDRKATESFLQECIVSFTDTVLVVFNRLTFLDQVFFAGLRSQVIQHKRSQTRGSGIDIIVIHNFRDIVSQEALDHVVNQGIALSSLLSLLLLLWCSLIAMGGCGQS